MNRSLALFLLLGLTACGAASSASDHHSTSTVAGPIVSTPTTPREVAPSTIVAVSTSSPAGLPPLPAAVLADPLVIFQAGWLCQSSKTAYATASDIDSALGVFLASSGVDRPAYDAFLVALDGDTLKRAGVQYLYLQSCP